LLLQNLFSGKGEVRFGATIQSVASYLSKGSQSGSKIENSKQFKQQEAKRLEIYISENEFWISDIDFTQYVSEGAEQRVYLKNSDHVLKLNDGIYYGSWRDYFYNLLIHNYYFEDTAYELLGFTKENDILYAVVQHHMLQ
jgi:hypothetical protein